jgi:hypothetical protein
LHLVGVGALYSPAELLTPSQAWFGQALQQLSLSTRQAGQSQAPQLLWFGGVADQLPVAWQPRNDRSGSLWLLPMLLAGREDALDVAEQALETVLVQRGAASPPILSLCYGHFSKQVQHVCWMTHADLLAVLYAQWQPLGAEVLALLLDALWQRPLDSLVVTADNGKSLHWNGVSAGYPIHFDPLAKAPSDDLLHYRLLSALAVDFAIPLHIDARGNVTHADAHFVYVGPTQLPVDACLQAIEANQQVLGLAVVVQSTQLAAYWPAHPNAEAAIRADFARRSAH